MTHEPQKAFLDLGFLELVKLLIKFGVLQAAGIIPGEGSGSWPGLASLASLSRPEASPGILPLP